MGIVKSRRKAATPSPARTSATLCIPRYRRQQHTTTPQKLKNKPNQVLKKEDKLIEYLPIVTHTQTYGVFMVNMMTEMGSDNAIIACVDGIPYSAAHLCSRRTTGGIGGLGHRITSFNP
jgi:hypothetical protein